MLVLALRRGGEGWFGKFLLTGQAVCGEVESEVRTMLSRLLHSLLGAVIRFVGQILAMDQRLYRLERRVDDLEKK